MAFSLYYYNDTPAHTVRKFLCDTRADINSLPTNIRTDVPSYPNGTPAGSTAFVVEDGSVWVLNNVGAWVEI